MRTKFLKAYLFLLFMSSVAVGLNAQHVVPEPDCSEPGFTVLTKRYNLEPKEWTPYPSRVVCQLPNFDMNETFVEKNVYGSRTDKKVEATGFFRTEKINGRWWIVDPEGYLQINVGVCAVNKNSTERNKKAFAEKYNNSTEEWMKDTKAKLKNYGFYSATAWTDKNNLTPDKATNPLSYTPIFNFATTYASRRTTSSYKIEGYGTYTSTPSNLDPVLHVFDPEFVAFCEHFARVNIRPLANDKDVLGYFSDNELTFGTGSLAQCLNVSDKTYPGYLAAKAFVESHNYTENDAKNGTKTSGATLTVAQLRDAWLGHVGERYYSTIRNAIKKYAPNQMYIGSRLHIPYLDYEGLVKAAVEYLDIISFNTYRVWYTSKEKADFWATHGDKPFLVTEFYAKGEDVFDTQGNKFPNKSGSGYIVYTQKERGYFYQTFCLGMLEAKNCVGWHHFKYMDNDPEDTSGTSDPSNVDSNKGLVDNEYNYYTDMMDQAKILNDRIYNLVDYFDARSSNPTPVGPIVEIYPEADANYKDATNEGTAQTLAVKAASPYRESIVRFDLSSIPTDFAYAGFKIESARTITDPETNVYAIDVVNDNTWSETGITKSTMPVSSYLGIHTWFENTGTTANVTNYVKEAKEKGQTKISFKIRVSTQGTADYMAFGSRENTDVSKKPVLQYAMEVTGVNNLQGVNEMWYTNPVPGKVILSINRDTQSDVTINLYSVTGQLVSTIYQGLIENREIPFDIPASGIYFIQVVGKDGNKTIKAVVR